MKPPPPPAPAAPLHDVVAWLDALLDTATVPDYGNAINGLQLQNAGTVTRVAAAVDFSRRTIDGAIAAGANLLVVHHGMFWSGLQPIRDVAYERLQTLIEHDVAVYASHLPLDTHRELGNNRLLARALDLDPTDDFAQYKTVAVGVRGTSDLATADLADRVRAFTRGHDGAALVTPIAPPDRRTRTWAICTGAGASTSTLHEAASLGVDTLIVGEGPHHTAVEADELGIVVMYAGHYATETLGVQALAARIERQFGLPWSWIAAPTGL